MKNRNRLMTLLIFFMTSTLQFAGEVPEELPGNAGMPPQQKQTWLDRLYQLFPHVTLPTRATLQELREKMPAQEFKKRLEDLTQEIKDQLGYLYYLFSEDLQRYFYPETKVAQEKVDIEEEWEIIPEELPKIIVLSFNRLFPSDVEKLSLFELNKKFEAFKQILSQHRFTLKRFITEMGIQKKEYGTDLVRLCYIIGLCITSRFDKTYLYKGGLQFDQKTLLASEKFTQDDYDALIATTKNIKQLESIVSDDFYSKVAEQQDAIREKLAMYKSWVNHYPVLSQQESELETFWKNSLRQKANELFYQYRQAMEKRIKGKEIRSIVNEYKKIFVPLKALMFRSSSPSIINDFKNRYTRQYQAVTGAMFDPLSEYRTFIKNIEKNYQLSYAGIQELKRQRPINIQALNREVKKALRYKQFENYQQFIALKRKLL